MTSYEKMKAVRHFIMSRAGEAMAYNWGSEFVARYLKETARFALNKHGKISLMGITVEQCDDLGFAKWSAESPIRLIPIWLYEHLATGDTLHCIDGTKVVVLDDYSVRESAGYIDNDCRGGCLAYGVIPIPS